MWLLKKIIRKSALKEVVEAVECIAKTDKEKKELFTDIYRLHAEVRAKERNLYGRESAIQKLLAIVFLVLYIALVIMILYWTFNSNGIIANRFGKFEITLMSALFGAMTVKISTIISFYFGSAKNTEKTLPEKGCKNLIQRIIITISLCVVYIVILCFIFNIFGIADRFSDFEITLLSALFGAMTAKISTIISFYFGSAKNNEKTLSEK